MASIFVDLFNMSITASYLVFAVVVARLLLKKAPKWINCLLWALVGIRLICPFSFESSLSLVPGSQIISVNNSSTARPFTVESGIPVVDSSINEFLGDKYYEGVTVPTNTFSDMTTILSIVWLVGLLAMLLYGSISYLRLHKKVGASILLTDNIYYCDNIDTPFILGLFKPEIYVPSGISEEQMSYIALHEKAHLKRKDHFWKPLGFILLSVYWFNPVMWVAYILLCRDIETACDEKVIKNMSNTEKKSYSETLVSCSVQRRMVMACPLAFGEVGVKQRIKSVLNYKKPAFWVIVLAFVLFTFVAVCFISNPVNNKVDKILNEDGYEVFSTKEQNISFYFTSWVLTDEMFERDGVYRVHNRDIINDCVIFRFKEVHSHDDMFTLTFDVAYEDVPDDGTIYVVSANQFEGGLELGDEIRVSDPFGEVGNDRPYSSYCHSKGPGYEFCFDVPKAWFENRRNNKIVVNFDTLAVVYEKSKPKGNNSSIGIIGGADGPTSIIVSDKNTKKEMKKMKKKYPHFFNLDTSDGLLVYVTEKDVSHHMCYLSSGENTVNLQEFKDFSKFAFVEEMALILTSYDISGYDVQVVPFQHELSDYVWEDMEADIEYFRESLGLPSMEDESLKTFNATVIAVTQDGTVVEPLKNESEWEKDNNQIVLSGIFSDVINEKIRVVYYGRIIDEHSTYPRIISSVIAVDNIADEKVHSNVVSLNIDKNLLDLNYSETTFLKEMKEYGAKVLHTVNSETISVEFNENQYNNFLQDKYRQVAAFYSGFKYLNTYTVITDVKFDKDFRNLKIYIDKELYEVTSTDQLPGVITGAYAYQMFLEDSIGVNAEIIDYKTNKVYDTITYPEDDWRFQNSSK